MRSPDLHIDVGQTTAYSLDLAYERRNIPIVDTRVNEIGFETDVKRTVGSVMMRILGKPPTVSVHGGIPIPADNLLTLTPG